MASSKETSYSNAILLLSANISDLKSFAKSKKGRELEVSFTKTICWCKGLAIELSENDARIFLGGAWSEIINILALVPLNFYRQSIISMRIILDQILAWSYYESHPVEFETSIKNPDFWIGKEKIYEFLRIHRWKDSVDYKSLGLWAEVNRLYSELSYFIHASSIEHMSLIESFGSYKRDQNKINEVIKLAMKTDEAISAFLASLYQDPYTQFKPEYQTAILKGWPKKKIQGLGLSP